MKFLLLLLLCPVLSSMLSLVPMPKSLIVNDGTFSIDTSSFIVYTADELEDAAAALQYDLRKIYKFAIPTSNISFNTTGDRDKLHGHWQYSA
eukprot:m.85931 g.85931  ORF g.85931 m.85931 type:complete len:92 (+) comp13031_c0_seq5:88-363(+)